MLAPGARRTYGWPLRHSSASDSTRDPKTSAATASQMIGWLTTSTKIGQTCSLKKATSRLITSGKLILNMAKNRARPSCIAASHPVTARSRSHSLTTWKIRIPPRISTSRKNDSISATTRPSTRQPVPWWT